MKRIKLSVLLLVLALLLASCKRAPEAPSIKDPAITNSVQIKLSDENITVDGKPAPTDSASAVYIANDIVYAKTNHDHGYNAGAKTEIQATEDTKPHNVVHITKPGTYTLSGKLSRGQIAVDLGEDAKNDPTAVVTLVLDNADITCLLAPAVIFYNVYECGNTDVTKATKDVDTSAAGANVRIADGSKNNIYGAYVAFLSQASTDEEEDAPEYDGAFYSRMSMNVDGDTGVLDILGTNEGLDSEMHLTINGGNINIASANDGINTNADNLSVTTINGGNLNIRVTGETGEGDGIDSNGYLVINGGTVTAIACADSADAGIDADKGIYINGGTVIASGNMLDRIESGGQNYAVFRFSGKQSNTQTLRLKDSTGKAVMEFRSPNSYSSLVFSSPKLIAGKYTLWRDEIQLGGYSSESDNMPPKFEIPTDFPAMEIPEGQIPMERPEGQIPMERPEGQIPPDNRAPTVGTRPEMQAGNRPSAGPQAMDLPLMTEFTVVDGANFFTDILPIE